MILRGLWKFFMCFSQFFLLGGTYRDRHVTIASCLFSLQTCRCSESPRNHQICWGHKSNRQDMPWSSDSINPYHEKCCGCANYSTIYIFNITYVSVSDWFVSSCSSFFVIHMATVAEPLPFGSTKVLTIFSDNEEYMRSLARTIGPLVKLWNGPWAAWSVSPWWGERVVDIKLW